MGLGDTLLSLFGITKRRAITAVTAATLVSTSFGFLMRDIVNFGKMEGDKRPAYLARAEKRIFKEALMTIEKMNVDEGSLDAAEIEQFRKLFENMRSFMNVLEKAKENADNFEDVENYKAALAQLDKIYEGLKNVILLVFKPFDLLLL